jgi:hypothetical protein
MIDTLAGAAFHARHLWLALRLGDPRRALRALAVEIGQRGALGIREDIRVGQLLASTRAQAEVLGDPHVIGLVETMAGSFHWMNGRWREARDQSQRAIDVLTTSCGSPAWETTTAQIFAVGGLVWLGAYAEHRTRLRALLDRAIERSDLFGEISLRLLGGEHLVFLAEDRPDEAAESTKEALRRWPGPEIDLQRFWGLYAEVHAALYKGDWPKACRSIDRAERTVRRSQLLRIEMIRTIWLHLCARCALAAQAARQPAARRTTERLAARLAGIGTPVAMAFATAIHGESARIAGRDDEAVPQLRAAAEQFRALDMPSYAMAAQERWGRLVGGEAGGHAVAGAESFFRSEGVREPLPFSRALLISGGID